MEMRVSRRIIKDSKKSADSKKSSDDSSESSDDSKKDVKSPDDTCAGGVADVNTALDEAYDSDNWKFIDEVEEKEKEGRERVGVLNHSQAST